MKKRGYLSIVIALSYIFGAIPIFVVFSQASSSALVVQTNFGAVQGTQLNSNTYAWLGIPYAKPPVGDLRWKAPQDPDPWTEIRQTTQFGQPSVQVASIFGSDNLDDIEDYNIIGSEDCLYVNIWKPTDASGSLPVYFFIHGGAYIYGQGAQDVYDGSNLANKADCIVVNFNYRLGTAGFFKNPALQTGNPLENSGNFGILDQIKALEWTKNNIKNFGGDPNHIIIAGESAGGFSVYNLLTSPYLKQQYFDKGIELFHAAVIESGIIMPTDPASAEGYSNDLLVQVLIKNGLAGSEEQAQDLINAASPAQIKSWLMEEDMQSLIALSQLQSLSLMSLLTTVMGITDGYVVASDPYERMQSGNFIKVPTIIGSNQEETKLFTAVAVEWTFQFNPRDNLWDLVEESTLITLNSMIAMIVEGFELDIDIPDIYAWLMIYSYNQIADMLTEILFTTLGREQPASYMVQYNPNIYVYEFGWNQEPYPLGDFVGAAHTMELGFVFGNMDPNGVYGDFYTSRNARGRQALSNAMMSYWKNFITDGNPGDPDGGSGFREGLPDWDPYTARGADKIIFDADNRRASIKMD
ncbi:MAG: carboxylesterase/lipase family protein [Promethearchaeota archaeon]